MKKIVLTAVAVFSVLLVLTGCPGAAGGSVSGTNSGEIDYLARLIGTWKTHDYDADQEENQYVSVVDTGITPSVTYDIKAKWTFTRTSISWEATYKNSSDEHSLKNGHQSSVGAIESVTDSYFKSSAWSHKTYYKIIDNKLYLNNEDFLYWEKTE